MTENNEEDGNLYSSAVSMSSQPQSSQIRTGQVSSGQVGLSLARHHPSSSSILTVFSDFNFLEKAPSTTADFFSDDFASPPPAVKPPVRSAKGPDGAQKPGKEVSKLANKESEKQKSKATPPSKPKVW